MANMLVPSGNVCLLAKSANSSADCPPSDSTAFINELWYKSGKNLVPTTRQLLGSPGTVLYMITTFAPPSTSSPMCLKCLFGPVAPSPAPESAPIGMAWSLTFISVAIIFLPQSLVLLLLQVFVLVPLWPRTPVVCCIGILHLPSRWP